MKRVIILLCLLLLWGSIVQASGYEGDKEVDQCLRREITLELLKALPAGPSKINNSNDWEEVVNAIGNQAFYLSLRQKNQIKPECLPGEGQKYNVASPWR